MEQAAGVELGKQRNERETTPRRVAERFGEDVNGETERPIANATLEQLNAWAGRMLSATTLAEVLEE